MPPVLELHGATVVRHGRTILDGLSLVIHAGEHTAILGPNGAGKSALIRLLTHDDRSLPRSDGISPVQVFGEDKWDVFELRSQLGIVSANLHHGFISGNNEGPVTAEAAVLSGFHATHGVLRYGVITDEMRRLAEEALAEMGVSHLRLRRLHEMSSGEARRVLLARALATGPRALILDEPTTGLDVVSRDAFMEHVRHIARNGTTLVLVTHHVNEIVPEVERVLLLRDGRIMGSGPRHAMLTTARLSELFDAPIDVEEEGGFFHARVRRSALPETSLQR